ncbi:hypothetical protein T492DRAFT_901715 [Pavlovales sp. CCMP2436]|nr:hypothetical protein T492DRAFT_901715 [Pavlovales sp. CCMP2436]
MFLGGAFARLAAPSHGLLRARPFLELTRALSTVFKKKKRIKLNAKGFMKIMRAKTHLKMGMRNVGQSMDSGIQNCMGIFTVTPLPELTDAQKKIAEEHWEAANEANFANQSG